ncbi:FGFP2 protein, partial [Amia calva]|nr:FGFP2 protein [Amia calva]
MKAWTSSVLFFACCLWAVNGQSKKSSAEEQFRFNTKSKDACVMTVSGEGEMKLRIVCKNQGKSYWCEYTGKPSVCRSFNANPKQYWNQISMERRKTTNACQGAMILKPSMCQKAPVDAHMKQIAAGPKLVMQKPTQSKSAAKVTPARKTPSKPTPTTSTEQNADRMAQEHCWESLHDVCAYIFDFFQGLN